MPLQIQRQLYRGLLASAFLVCFSSASSVCALDVAWICTNGDYNNPDCWNLTVVPCNVGALGFNVAFPDGSATVQLGDELGHCQISQLILGNNKVLRLLSSSVPSELSLTVLGASEILGVVDADNADFTALQGVFPGNRARVYAANGATVTIGAPSYGATGWYGTSGAWPTVRTHNLDLLRAMGVGTLLDLSSVQWIDAAFDDGDGWDTNLKKIIASDAGRLDLSGVQWIKTPLSGDWLFIVVSDGAEINLDRLVSITSDRSGWAKVEVKAASLPLPALETVHQVSFELDEAGVVTLGEAFSEMTVSRIWLAGGAQFEGGP